MKADHPDAGSADALEPGVRTFVDRVCAEVLRRTGGRALGLEVTRRIAEEARAPWREGGPLMARTLDLRVPGSQPVRVRIHHPAAGEPNGALVYMHGGGWTLFSLDTHDRLMREYAARSGLAVVGVDYSLAPEHRFPRALEEVVQVIDWLVAEGESVGVDPARLAAGGDSAGANLALAAALRRRDHAGDAGLRALLLSYGCYQVEVSAAAARRFGGPRFMLTPGEMAGFWAGYLRSPADAADPLASPLLADLTAMPPTFLAIAECDILAEQSRLLEARLRAAGVPTTTAAYAGASHSFLEAVAVSPLAALALQDASDWLAERCR